MGAFLFAVRENDETNTQPFVASNKERMPEITKAAGDP
jgi:hypothetical protein